jgi:hypothetical protein
MKAFERKIAGADVCGKTISIDYTVKSFLTQNLFQDLKLSYAGVMTKQPELALSRA